MTDARCNHADRREPLSLHELRLKLRLLGRVANEQRDARRPPFARATTPRLASERSTPRGDVERVVDPLGHTGVGDALEHAHEAAAVVLAEHFRHGPPDERFDRRGEETLITGPHAEVAPFAIELEEDAAGECGERLDALLEIVNRRCKVGAIAVVLGPHSADPTTRLRSGLPLRAGAASRMTRPDQRQLVFCDGRDAYRARNCANGWACWPPESLHGR